MVIDQSNFCSPDPYSKTRSQRKTIPNLAKAKWLFVLPGFFILPKRLIFDKLKI